jgi:hypothetical protein
MTILAIVEAKIEPQRAKDVIRLLRGALPSTRSFEGCAGVKANLRAKTAPASCWLSNGTRKKRTRNTPPGARQPITASNSAH